MKYISARARSRPVPGVPERSSRRSRRFVQVIVLLSFTAVAQATPQEPRRPAFVDVSVVPMDSERVVPGQTVLVQGDRMVNGSGKEDHPHVAHQGGTRLEDFPAYRPQACCRTVSSLRCLPGCSAMRVAFGECLFDSKTRCGARGGREPKLVRTVHGFGYAFCGGVADLGVAAAPEGGPAGGRPAVPSGSMPRATRASWRPRARPRWPTAIRSRSAPP